MGTLLHTYLQGGHALNQASLTANKYMLTSCCFGGALSDGNNSAYDETCQSGTNNIGSNFVVCHNARLNI